MRSSPHHVAGVFGVAKLQPDAGSRADAEQRLMEIVREEIGDIADVDLEAHLAAGGPAAAVLGAAAGAALIDVGPRGAARPPRRCTAQ